MFGIEVLADEITSEVLKAQEFSGKRESVKLHGSLAKLPEIGKQVRLFLLSRKKIAGNVQTTE